MVFRENTAEKNFIANLHYVIYLQSRKYKCTVVVQKEL